MRVIEWNRVYENKKSYNLKPSLGKFKGFEIKLGKSAYNIWQLTNFSEAFNWKALCFTKLKGIY